MPVAQPLKVVINGGVPNKLATLMYEYLSNVLQNPVHLISVPSLASLVVVAAHTQFFIRSYTTTWIPTSSYPLHQ